MGDPIKKMEQAYLRNGLYYYNYKASQWTALLSLKAYANKTLYKRG